MNSYKQIKKVLEDSYLTENKEDKKSKSAILYLKSKNINYDIKNNEYIFNLNNSFNDSELKNNLNEIIEDSVGELIVSNDLVEFKIVLADEFAWFTQPFSKDQVEYKTYEELVKNAPTEDSEDSEDLEVEWQKYWDKYPACFSCVHLSLTSSIDGSQDSSNRLCHLVRGFINGFDNCNMHTKSLMKENNPLGATSNESIRPLPANSIYKNKADKN
jgi:hypothetical protein